MPTFKVSQSMINDISTMPASGFMSSEDIRYEEFKNIKNRIKIFGYGEMCKYVQDNIKLLLSSAVDKKPKALQILTDRDFLMALNMCELDLSKDYVNRFNRVYRAYTINPAKNVIYNQETAKLMYQVALRLNKRMVDIMMSVGLTEEDALWLIVNRYSSTDERRNIRRMVRAMQHMSPGIMTEQMVVNIFSKTFQDQLTNLFCAIMTDRFDSFDSKDEEFVYSTVSMALLQILNSMDVDDIKDIIMEYLDEINKSGTSGRFPLDSINPSDFDKINKALDSLEEMGIKIE